MIVTGKRTFANLADVDNPAENLVGIAQSARSIVRSFTWKRAAKATAAPSLRPHRSWSLTAMGYHGRWSSTDQVAQRAIASGVIDRFGAIDPTDGGHTYRYSGSMDWQHGSGNALTKITA